MIVRPKMHWLRMLFIWRGSVLRNILIQLLLVFIISSVIAWKHGVVLGYTVPLTATPFTLLGVSLALFLGFRNSASYDRFWEGRKLWGTLLNCTRSITREGLSLASLSPDDPRMKELVLLLVAFTHALRHQLRGSDPQEDFSRLLPESSQAALKRVRFRPAIILIWLGGWVSARKKEGLFGEITATAFNKNLNVMSDVLGGCERLANTLLPYPYSIMIHRTVYLYCLLLPFGLVSSIGRMTPILSVLIAYSFMALEALAEEIEEPFGTSANDLALESMSQSIEATLLEMIGEPIDPTPPVPKDWVVL